MANRWLARHVEPYLPKKSLSGGLTCLGKHTTDTILFAVQTACIITATGHRRTHVRGCASAFVTIRLPQITQFPLDNRFFRTTMSDSNSRKLDDDSQSNAAIADLES